MHVLLYPYLCELPIYLWQFLQSFLAPPLKHIALDGFEIELTETINYTRLITPAAHSVHSVHTSWFSLTLGIEK